MIRSLVACSTGMTAPPGPAVAGAAGAGAPTPIGCGCRRSCCSRRRSRRSGRYFRRLRGALAERRRRWRRRRSTRCSRPGPGSATTRGPATCMPAPGSWSGAWRRASRQARQGSCALPGIGRLHGGGDRRHRLRRAGTRRWTAMSSGWWPGCCGDRQPLPAAKPQIRATGGRADAGPARRRFRPGADGPRRAGVHAASGPPAAICPLAG